MILKKLHTLNFEDNDIYRIESYQDKIIANEDYHGIRILDFSLNTIKVIPLFEGLIVDFIYKKLDGNAIIVCDLDNNRLVLVDLQFFTHSIIQVEPPKNGYFFSRNYYWRDNIFILAIENKNIFYQLNFETLTLNKISQKKVTDLVPEFVIFSNACRKYKAVTIYPEKEAFIFKKNRNLIGFYDYKSKNLILTKHKLGDFEDVDYHRSGFIFFYLWEKCIAFQKNKVFISSADPNYYCLRTNFLSNDTILILETNRDDHKFCILSVYQLIDE